MLLEKFYEKENTLFFSQEMKQELKFVIDDMYNYPLLESSKFTLGRMLRSGNSPDDIVECILDMHKHSNLCRIYEEKNDSKAPSIICSMGLRKI